MWIWQLPENFPNCFQEIIDEGGYLPEQVFSIDEIGPNGKEVNARL